MKLIAAVDNNWAIGNKGDLLIHISEDMKFFKNTTMGHVVVLGRKTLLGFPHSKPLPGRPNVIMSRDENFKVEGAVVVHSIHELRDELSQYDTDDIFVIGGMAIYNELLPYCDTAYITKIEKSFEADAFIENLDENPDWEMIYKGEANESNGVMYSFTTYKNNHPEEL